MFATILVWVVAVIHLYFMYLEMIKWEAPRTRKVFGVSETLARDTVKLAANQGLYNGFIAGGLIVGCWSGNVQMTVYLLVCVAIAGLYALWWGIKPALIAQTLPALLALVAVWLSL